MPVPVEMVPFLLLEVFLFLGFRKMIEGDVEDTNGDCDRASYQEANPNEGKTLLVVPRSFASDGRKSLLPNFLGVLKNSELET